jgi:hypothetical protein
MTTVCSTPSKTTFSLAQNLLKVRYYAICATPNFMDYMKGISFFSNTSNEKDH